MNDQTIHVHVYHILPAHQLEAAWNNRIEVGWFEHCKRFVFLSRHSPVASLLRAIPPSTAIPRRTRSHRMILCSDSCLLQYSVSSEKENSRFSINLGNNLPCKDSYFQSHTQIFQPQKENAFFPSKSLKKSRLRIAYGPMYTPALGPPFKPNKAALLSGKLFRAAARQRIGK